MTRKEILDNAADIVCKDREDTYGSPENNFQIIADFWTLYLTAEGRTEITAPDVAMMLALLKIARIATGKCKDDNYIDLAGYAACGGEVASKKSDMENALDRELQFWKHIQSI